MPFEAGKEKTGGREKGTKNRVSNQVKDALEALLSDPANIAKLQTELKGLSGRDYLKAYSDFLPYLLPKYSSTNMDLNIDRLSDDQLEELWTKLEGAINNNDTTTEDK